MAKTVEQLLGETRQDFERLGIALEKAKETRDEYNRELRNARARLKRREESKYPDNLAEKFIDNMKKGNIPQATTIKWIDNAIDTNIEFSASAYKKALYEVANDKSIYKFFKMGSGWSTRIDFQIIFESVGGTLADWGSAVTKYREQVLHSKGLDSEKAGEKATEFWYDKVYGTELENKTIIGRLARAGTKAPFWQILNHGSQPLSSDRPGGYNPVSSSPTDFIGDAEFELEDQFLTLLNREYEVWFEEERKLRDVIAEYEEKRDEYSAEVKSLKVDINLDAQILTSFEGKEKFLSQKKLAKLLKEIKAGNEVINFDVALKSSKNQLLITIRSVEGYIE